MNEPTAKAPRINLLPLGYCEACDEQHPVEQLSECDCGRIVCELHSHYTRADYEFDRCER